MFKNLQSVHARKHECLEGDLTLLSDFQDQIMDLIAPVDKIV